MLSAASVVGRPLAGTRRRGKTPQDDLALEAELLADEKERAEHVMLVDLGRNDVGKARCLRSLPHSFPTAVEACHLVTRPLACHTWVAKVQTLRLHGRLSPPSRVFNL